MLAVLVACETINGEDDPGFFYTKKPPWEGTAKIRAFKGGGQSTGSTRYAHVVLAYIYNVGK